MANLAPQEIQEAATEVHKMPLPPVNLDILAIARYGNC